MNSKKFFYNFGKALYHVDSFYNEFAKQSNVSSALLWVLYALNDETSHTQIEISTDWELPKTTVNTVVRELKQKGYVELFPIGEPNDGYAKYFIGQSYLAPVSTEQVGIFNVTFEPGCRNNWHVHHADQGGGQILICVGGRGYYQEWGKEPQLMFPGDVVNIPVGVKHWHGAAPDSWFSHLAVEVPGVNGSNEWLEPVDDEQYGKVQ